MELTVESQACRLSIKLGAYAEIDGQYSDWDDLSPTEADLIASQVKKSKPTSSSFWKHVKTAPASIASKQPSNTQSIMDSTDLRHLTPSVAS